MLKIRIQENFSPDFYYYDNEVSGRILLVDNMAIFKLSPEVG
jgi:hypothetical protein